MQFKRYRIFKKILYIHKKMNLNLLYLQDKKLFHQIKNHNNNLKILNFQNLMDFLNINKKFNKKSKNFN